MLTLESLKEFSKKYQTLEKNVAREYVQHLFLCALYKLKGCEKLLFKGGTALRLIFQSPRFSEDLDFTGIGILRSQEIDDLFLATLEELEKIGLIITYQEAKPTSGGYLGIIRYKLFDIPENMEFEVSLRKTSGLRGEVTSVVTDLAPAYTLIHFPTKELVAEKIKALMARKKPRDYYDLYFISRHPELSRVLDKKQLSLVLNILRKEKLNFKKELSHLLPVSHHMVLKDFKKILTKEIQKYV